VPKDFDDAYDIYDAHECTESSLCFLPPPASPPPCDNGEGCKPAQKSQPSIFGEPASATFKGAGNPSFSPPPAEHKELTRAQKLAKALKACARLAKRKRAACKRAAEKKYGKPAAKKKRTVKRKRRSRK
jgi:hypothetical protein